MVPARNDLGHLDSRWALFYEPDFCLNDLHGKAPPIGKRAVHANVDLLSLGARNSVGFMARATFSH